MFLLFRVLSSNGVPSAIVCAISKFDQGCGQVISVAGELFKAGEYLAPMLLSWHNTAFFQEFMQTMRTAIANGTFNELRADLKSRWT